MLTPLHAALAPQPAPPPVNPHRRLVAMPDHVTIEGAAHADTSKPAVLVAIERQYTHPKHSNLNVCSIIARKFCKVKRSKDGFLGLVILSRTGRTVGAGPRACAVGVPPTLG